MKNKEPIIFTILKSGFVALSIFLFSYLSPQGHPLNFIYAFAAIILNYYMTWRSI